MGRYSLVQKMVMGLRDLEYAQWRRQLPQFRLDALFAMLEYRVLRHFQQSENGPLSPKWDDAFGAQLENTTRQWSCRTRGGLYD